MIYESSYWKDDLLRYAAALRKKTKQRHWSERSQAVVEKLVFLGFYSVRKLFEAEKLSTSLRQLSLVTAIYPPTGKNVTRHNWHKTDELFIRVFERVGRNYPHKTSFVFDPELKDYRIDSE